MRVSAPACRADDLIKNGLPDSAAQEGRARAHGFDLARLRVQLLQSAAPAEHAVRPRRPKGDARRAKAVDRKGMHMAGRSVAAHAGKVLGDERLHLCGGEVVWADGDGHDAVSVRLMDVLPTGPSRT